MASANVIGWTDKLLAYMKELRCYWKGCAYPAGFWLFLIFLKALNALLARTVVAYNMILAINYFTISKLLF